MRFEDLSAHGLERIGAAGEWPIYKVRDEETVAVKAKLDIDADGSPHAYAPHNRGLDVNIDAMDGSQWVGVATNRNGEPIIQGPGDPSPGYYVSTTALENPNSSASSPSRYVNSEEVPYIVIPHGHDSVGWKLGDLATVIRLSDGTHVQAIVGDIGPRAKFGEASIAVARALDVNPSPRIGGDQENHFAYLIYLGSAATPPWPRSVDELTRSAEALFHQAVGKNVLKGLGKAPLTVTIRTPDKKQKLQPLIVYSETKKSPEVEALQRLLNELPGVDLEVNGIPDGLTSARLEQVLGIKLQGAQENSAARSGGPFVVYDPHNKTDYTRLFQTWLGTLNGVDLEADGYAGRDFSDSLHAAFGSHLPGDPTTGAGPATPVIPFDTHHYSQYALRLQSALNAFPGVSLADDGYAGQTSSDSAKRVFGSYLLYDPRLETGLPFGRPGLTAKSPA